MKIFNISLDLIHYLPYLSSSPLYLARFGIFAGIVLKTTRGDVPFLAPSLWYGIITAKREKDVGN